MTDIALFGITGDLSRQKLIPSLFRLYQSGIISKEDALVGFGRKPFSGRELKDFIMEYAWKDAPSGKREKKQIEDFAGLWAYIQSELDDKPGYLKLGALLSDDAVIYLSLPPDLQEVAARNLIETAAVEKGSLRRIAFEKPFGHDGASAETLQSYLMRHLDERQVLRVDHYAGKQSLLDLERAAAIGVLGGFLDSRKLGRVDARLHETKTAEGRGAFYDSVGAVYDVGQSHVLHMLATVLALPLVEDSRLQALKDPALPHLSLAAARSLALRHVRFDAEKTVLAQYEGFAKEPGVDSSSTTETFFAASGTISALSQKESKGIPVIMQEIMLARWKGIEVRISGGKSLAQADTSISLELRGSKELVHIPVSGYGAREAHDEIFEAAISGDMQRFADFDQIRASWSLSEDIRRQKKEKSRGEQGAASLVKTYKKGTTPRF